MLSLSHDHRGALCQRETSRVVAGQWKSESDAGFRSSEISLLRRRQWPPHVCIRSRKSLEPTFSPPPRVAWQKLANKQTGANELPTRRLVIDLMAATSSSLASVQTTAAARDHIQRVNLKNGLAEGNILRVNFFAPTSLAPKSISRSDRRPNRMGSPRPDSRPTTRSQLDRSARKDPRVLAPPARSRARPAKPPRWLAGWLLLWPSRAAHAPLIGPINQRSARPIHLSAIISLLALWRRRPRRDMAQRAAGRPRSLDSDYRTSFVVASSSSGGSLLEPAEGKIDKSR